MIWCCAYRGGRGDRPRAAAARRDRARQRRFRAREAALRAAMARRGIPGGVRATAAPGVYRLRRRAARRGWCRSSFPPSPAAAYRDMPEVAARAHRLPQLRDRLVDNIRDENCAVEGLVQAQRRLRRRISRTVQLVEASTISAPRRRSANICCFSTTTSRSIDPRWLDALMEHAQRPEVGVVGAAPALSRRQRAARRHVSGSDRIARHAFRFAEADESGAISASPPRSATSSR